jgi:hypothetical protein
MWLASGSWVAIAAVGIAVLTGCGERERLTFPTGPDPGQNLGPITMIDRPNGRDTTVPAGPDFLVNGRTIDGDGVDTVYFLVTNGDHFQPFVPRPPSDTVRFGLPITTTGHSGDTILVGVQGVDRLGNQGGISTRTIFVQ